jgi:hypothetical protein
MKKIYTLLSILLVIQANIFSQALTGTKTIKSSGGDYSSFAAAANAINLYGVGDGGVTFNVDAGAEFYEANIYINTTSSNVSRPIVFKKSGSGLNPVIYGKGVNGANMDYIMGIGATDYVKFDGIDLKSDPAAVDDADKIECGFIIYNYSENGCDSITIKNCTIVINPRASASAIQQNGIYITQNAGSVAGINSNILISNVTFLNGRTPINIYALAIPNENIEVKNCKFGEASASVISPLDRDCVLKTDKCKNFSFHGNEIQNIVAPNFYVLKMDNFSGENNVYNNKIHNLRSTATEEVSGIAIIAPTSNDVYATCNIYNNLIYDFDGGKTSSTLTPNIPWNLAVIFINGTAKYGVYNNTIVGSSANSNENTMLCYATSNTEIKNNIFADYSAAGSTSFRAIFLSDANIENNLFWIDESLTNNYIYSTGSISYKFQGWQKGTSTPSLGYYLKNMMANPNFTDRANFNFTLKNPSPASNNGQPVAIVTSSLNGLARNANTPDIGAYEGDFGPATDLFPPLIRFQPIPYNLASEAKLTAEITDNTGVADAKLWYRNKGSVSSFSQVPGVQSGNIWNFTFPDLSAGVYEYFVCAKDASGNIISNGYILSGFDVANTGLAVNNPAANPDYVYSFAYKKTLVGGAYTVGTGGNYSSLTQPGGLFDDINSSLITGNLNITIISDLTETGQIALKQWQEYGAGNYTLTIKPNSTTLRTISNLTGNPVTITGASRITIDGSFNNDNLNHIKISANSTSPIKFNSTGTNGCKNITIKYCDFYALTWACILIEGNNHSDFLIENVNSLQGYSGVALFNVSRPVIRNCVFGNSDVNNTLTGYGVYLSGCSDILVEKNTVQNIINSVDNYSAIGIYSINTTGGSFSQNKITGVKNNATIGNGISDGFCAVSSKNLTVSNNIISGINGNGNALSNYTNGIKGVVLASCDNVKLYYNTINLYGTGNTIVDGICYALSTENSVNLAISNNIFSNTIDDANPSITTYTSDVVQLTSELSNIYRNNIYYAGGPSASLPFTIVNEGGLMDFASWRSKGFIPGNGRDLGSGVGDPQFTNSGSDNVSLLSASPAINSGIPLSITIDINGNARNLNTPDIGAIEATNTLTSDIIAPVIDYVPFANPIVTNPTFSATITDNVSVSTPAKMWYRVKGSTDAFTGIDGVKQGDNKTWNFTLSALIQGTEYEYFLCAKDNANNIITNGITNSALSISTIGLTDNSPAANPVFIRSFKVSTNVITLGTILGAPFYVSSTKTATINIPYTSGGTFTSNSFDAYLSDASGDFTSKIKIGTLLSNVSGTINATIPVGLNGTGYRIRVESNPSGIISDVSPAFQIINDNSGPAVTLSSIGSPVLLPFTVTIDFNEIVQGFAQTMITVTNATLSNFSTIVSNRQFTILVTPTKAGTVSVKIAAGLVKDLSDNYNVESNTISLTYIDSGAPYLNIAAEGDVYYFKTASIKLYFTFDQDVTGFASDDISVINGSIGTFAAVSSKVYTAILTPSSQGQVKISVAADAALNGTSKGNSASSLNLTYDNQQPGVSLSRVSGSGNVNSAFDIYIDFTEEIQGLSLDKLTVAFGTASNLIKESGTRYRVTINPSINSGSVTINFSADKVTDLANNSNTAAAALIVPVSSTQPLVAVSRTSGTGKVNGVFNVTITFGAAVTDFDESKLNVTNGAKGVLSGSGSSYTINITPTADGDVTINVPAGAAHDGSSNPNLASNELKVIADMTPPTVIVSRTTGSGVVSGTYNVTISFSEEVTGFAVGDIFVTGGSLSNLTQNGSLYQVDVTPTSYGQVKVSVPVGIAQDEAANSNLASNELITSAKAMLTVTADAKTKVYGAANPTLTFSYSGWKNGDTQSVLTTIPTASTTVSPTSAVGVNAGAITVSGGVDDNYDFTYIPGDFTVTKAMLTVTADAKTKGYGAANPVLTFSYNGWQNSETSNVLTTLPSATTTVTLATGVGTYTDAITLSGGVDDNYDFTYIAGTFTVTKAMLTVTALPQTKTYGAANPTLTLSYSGWQNSETLSVLTTPPTASTTVTLLTSVGTYTDAITVSGGVDDNYNFTYLSGTFTVTKAMLTATADPKTKAYGASNPTLTFQYSGWQNSDGPTLLTTAPSASTTVNLTTGVGAYPGAITLSGGVDDNYAFTYVAGTFTVTKAMLTVTADAKTKVYGTANPALTVSYSGFKNSETSTVLTTPPLASTIIDLNSVAGIHTDAITVSGGVDDNYDFTYVAANFTVAKAMLTVTADAKTKEYGAANPALTFSYSGWQNSETSSVLTTPPSVSTTVNLTTGAGIHAGAITLSGGIDDNYDFTYVAADFTITKAMLTVTADAKTKVYGAANPTLTFTYSGWVNGDGVAQIDTPPTASTTVNPTTNVGIYIGAIVIAGGVDNNYLFDYVAANFEITPKTITITPTPGQSKKEGDPDPVFTYTNTEWSDNALLTGVLGRVAGETVGYYAYTLGDLSAGTNYSLIIVGSPSTFSIATATGMEEHLSSNSLILKNYPNPFDSYTTISYSLPFDGKVTLTIRNLNGQLLKTIVNEMETKGDYNLNIEDWGLQSGVYVVSLTLKASDNELYRTIKVVKSR